VNINPNRLQIDDVTGSSGAAAFEGNLKVDSGYIAIDSEFIPTVRVSLGGRYEAGRQNVRTIDLFGGPSVFPPTIDKENFLPAGTITWNFAEDMQARLGASRTLSRPQFRELSEQQFIDIEDDRVFFGNRFLQNSRIDAIDARYEWYFGKDQFLTLGAFYKNIDRPIEEIVSAIGDRPQTTFINVPRARLVGAEVEFKKFFEFNTGVAFFDNKRYLVNLNYTFSDGKIKVDAGDVVFAQAGNGSPSPATNFVSDGLRLQGQSRHLANLQLGFEDDTARSQAALTATFVGKRISARGIAPQPDFIQDPGVLLDFTYRKGFTLFSQDFEVSFNARNLLGEDSEEFQEIGSDRIEINTFDIGRSFSLSLTAKF
jgi:outer membrane receptor protein involved in Fe transport